MDNKQGEIKKRIDGVQKRNRRKCQNYSRNEEYITRCQRDNRLI